METVSLGNEQYQVPGTCLLALLDNVLRSALGDDCTELPTISLNLSICSVYALLIDGKTRIPSACIGLTLAELSSTPTELYPKRDIFFVMINKSPTVSPHLFFLSFFSSARTQRTLYASVAHLFNFSLSSASGKLKPTLVCPYHMHLSMITRPSTMPPILPISATIMVSLGMLVIYVFMLRTYGRSDSQRQSRLAAPS